jgi:hypothetical protein
MKNEMEKHMKSSIVLPTIYAPEPRLFLSATDGESFLPIPSISPACEKGDVGLSDAVSPLWVRWVYQPIRDVLTLFLSGSLPVERSKGLAARS